MTNALRGALCAVLAVVLIGSPVLSSTAVAQDRERARELFRKANQHYDLGEFQQALDSFKEAFRAFEDPTFLYNIGQCHRQIGAKEPAIAAYKSYLRRLPNASNAGAVRDVITRLEKAVEDERAAAPATAPPAPTSPPPKPPTEDGAEPPPVAPPPGQRATTPTEAGLDLSTPSPAPAPHDAVETRPIWKRGWFWGVVGGAAAVVILGVVVAAKSGGGDSVRTLPELRPQ